jgi:hypothetical protein
MRRSSALAPVAATLLVAATALGGTTRDVEPGDRVGRMSLVRGTAATADQKLFDSCNPVVLRTGRRHRSCGVVSRVRRLFIGYGLFADQGEIDDVWAETTWSAWLDGRRILLRAFGTSDRTLYAFPPAGGKTVTLREWRVTLVGATPGRHTLRYRSRDAAGVADTTWTFTVAAA